MLKHDQMHTQYVGVFAYSTVADARPADGLF
jgi:hypothetical protein